MKSRTRQQLDNARSRVKLLESQLSEAQRERQRALDLAESRKRDEYTVACGDGWRDIAKQLLRATFDDPGDWGAVPPVELVDAVRRHMRREVQRALVPELFGTGTGPYVIVDGKLSGPGIDPGFVGFETERCAELNFAYMLGAKAVRRRAADIGMTIDNLAGEIWLSAHSDRPEFSQSQFEIADVRRTPGRILQSQSGRMMIAGEIVAGDSPGWEGFELPLRYIGVGRAREGPGELLFSFPSNVLIIRPGETVMVEHLLQIL